MKLLVAVLILLLCLFQYRLWLGDGNLRELHQMQQRIDALNRDLDVRRERNLALRAEVKDLDSGLEAIEEHARQDLGMVAPGETFFQLIND